MKLPEFFNECQQLTINDKIPEEAAIYALWNKQENKFYIGYTSNLNQRINHYKTQKVNNKNKENIQIEMCKNWQEHYSIVIIQQSNNIKELMKLEAEIISEYKTSNLLYNKITKNKISEIKIDEKTRKKIENQIKKTNSCWIWNGSVDKNGYGRIGINKKHYPCHRIVYYIYKQDKEIDFLHVLHKCNNKLCCNPDHLCLGTDKENSIDSIIFNTTKKSKISLEQAKEIKEKRIAGLTVKEISKETGINEDLIYAIFAGKIRSLIEYKCIKKKKVHSIIKWINNNEKYIQNYNIQDIYKIYKKEKTIKIYITIKKFTEIIEKNFNIKYIPDKYGILHKCIDGPKTT